MKYKLDRSFYHRSTLEVARQLLGREIVHETASGMMRGRIVEAEAYIGAIDKAAHCYQNKRTPRTEVMFGPPGHAYVYLIYGMYHCFNIVTQAEGEAAAVLIRAVEPIEGMTLMANNRYGKSIGDLTKAQVKNLTNGPGKLCAAMGIDKGLNGADLCSGSFYLTEGNDEPFEMIISKRINIDYAEEAIDFPWRFYIKDNPHVSRT